MFVIRSCCDNVFPKIRKDLFCRYLIYCPHCGYSVIGDSWYFLECPKCGAMITFDDSAATTIFDVQRLHSRRA